MIYTEDVKITRDFGKDDIHFIDRFRFGSVYLLLHIFRDNQFLQNKRKEIILGITKKLTIKRTSEGFTEGQTFEVERIDKNTSEKDFKKYVQKGIPVIFTGGAEDWECTKKWNLDYLNKKFGDVSFPIVSRKGLLSAEEKPPEGFDKEYTEKVLIKDFVQEVKDGGDLYMRFSPIMEQNESLIKDFDLSWLRKMRQCLFGASYQTFIGRY